MIPLKSTERLKIGRAHSFMSLPAKSLFSFVSFGCLYKYITAFPIPECFSVDCSIGGNYDGQTRIVRVQEQIKIYSNSFFNYLPASII